jgi:hypothetical protein
MDVSALSTDTPLQVSEASAVPAALGSIEVVHSTVASAGHVIEGTAVSITVITWTQLDVFSHSSSAVQVRVNVNVPPQPGALLSALLIVTPSQVSLASALPLVATVVSAGHSRVIEAGQVIEGAVVSTTSIVWSQLALFPHASVAVHVRTTVTVLPQPGVVSSSELIVKSQLSVAFALPFDAMLVNAGHSLTSSPGQEISGASVSVRVIVCVQLASLPQSSTAVHPRPISHGLPASVSSKVTVTYAHVSLAVALPVFEGSASPMHSTEMSSGQSIVGGIVSTTVIVWETLEELPEASVAVQVRISITASPGAPESNVRSNVNVGLESQLSDTETTAGFGKSAHSTVASAGTVEITGASVSGSH